MQGDNLDPTLFAFVVQLVDEDTLAALKIRNAEIISLKHDNDNEKMKLHNLKDIIAMNKKEMNLLRCVDDSAFILKD